jgi:hypothetical protein
MANNSRSRTDLKTVFNTVRDMLKSIKDVEVHQYIYTDIIKAFGVLASAQPNTLVIVHNSSKFSDNEPFVKHNVTVLLSVRDCGTMDASGDSAREIADSVVNIIDTQLLGKTTKKMYMRVTDITGVKFTDNSLESGYEIKFYIDDNGEDL